MPALRRSAKGLLKDARSLLALASVKENRGCNPQHSRIGLDARRDDDGWSANSILQCFALLKDLHQLSIHDRSCDFDLRDWAVVKAVVELVVRVSIYPFLSTGVGIPLHRRFGEKAAAAAAAVSDQVDKSAVSNAQSLTCSRTESCTSAISTHELLQNLPGADESYLLESAELLASLLDKNLANDDGCQSPFKTRDMQSTAGVTGPGGSHVEQEASRRDDCTGDASAFRQLVLSRHLVDLFAAYFQLAYGPIPHTGTSQKWKDVASSRIAVLTTTLPVAHVVEALFILIGKDCTNPPVWLTSQVGKFLSRAILREGGLATVMQTLVGRTERGNMHVYQRVANHLAKCPTFVATCDEYYKTVCSQLVPLLLLPHTLKDNSRGGDIANQLVSNMHQTSIHLACNLTYREPKLADKYLLLPMVEPLLCWGTSQMHRMQTSNVSTPQIFAVLNSSNEVATEENFVHSLEMVQMLLTAGSSSSRLLQNMLLEMTKPVAPMLLVVLIFLGGPFAKANLNLKSQQIEDSCFHEEKNQTVSVKSQSGPGGIKKGLEAGFLLGKQLFTIGESEEQDSPLNNIVYAISDIMVAHLTQQTGHSLPIVLAFLFNLDPSSVEWPSLDGDIAGAINTGRRHFDDRAIILSNFLLEIQNWHLVVLLLEAMLYRRKELLYGQHMKLDDSSSSSLKTIKTILRAVGMKAFQKYNSAAFPFLQSLLDDKEASEDIETLQLMFQLVGKSAGEWQTHDSDSSVQRIDDFQMGSASAVAMKSTLSEILSSRSTEQLNSS